MLQPRMWQSAALRTERTGSGHKMKKSEGHLAARPMLSLGQKHHKRPEHARKSQAVLEALLLIDVLPTSRSTKSTLTWKHFPPVA